MRYLPHTAEEIADMLKTIGVGSIDDLFEQVPPAARLGRSLDIPGGMPESQLMSHMRQLASRNATPSMTSFLGAGMYSHHVPPAVDQLLLRSEFYTAYTPYQPEVAQGTLQAIWEFQTIVSELYGLPLANASMYDGASAAAEAVQMARRLTRRDRVVLSDCLHPDYRAVVRTYLQGSAHAEVVAVPVASTGATDVDALRQAMDDRTACVLVGYPSFMGGVVDLRPLVDTAHEGGALAVTANTEPYAYAVLQPPGALGVDIAVGEGQPLACPPQFGGPGLGLFACRQDRKYLQQLPGRLCGETLDKNGKRGFVLTMSTREQHIRRERATSNICTNQGLLALSLAIRVSMLGKVGFQRAAQDCFEKARYLHDAIVALPGYSDAFDPAPFFNEFALRVRDGSADAVCRAAEKAGIVAGHDLGRTDPALKDRLLVAVTETHTREQLDAYVGVLASV